MSFPDVDVTDWDVVGEEQMGEPGKLWVEKDSERWLFKPVPIQNDRRGPFPQGDDWAERIAFGLAGRMGVPAAHVELAHRKKQIGSISRDITSGRRLSLGNELFASLDPEYPGQQAGTVAEYSVERIFEVLVAVEVQPSPDATGARMDAAVLFAGFLVLDAWVANQDRHHGNWGILEDLVGGSAPSLAPSFDHGSSLGFQLHDEARSQQLAAKTIPKWAARGICRPMANRPNLVTLAKQAIALAGASAREWLDRLATVTSEDEASIVNAVPDGRMSQPARIFALTVLETNRRRLLDDC